MTVVAAGTPVIIVGAPDIIGTPDIIVGCGAAMTVVGAPA